MTSTSHNTFSGVQIVYGLLAIIGVIVTWYHNILFIDAYGGFSVLQYVADNYVNHASSSISNDILIVVAAFFIWSYREAKKLDMKHWWLYAVLTFGIAIAFTMPLFLLMRERRLQALSQ